MGLPLLLLAAVSSGTLQVDSIVRAGCGSDEKPLATLTAGQTVEIRSALSGSSGTCYKVVAQKDGATVQGYVEARAVKGESFDQARRDARSLGAAGGQSQVKQDSDMAVEKAAKKAGREHPASKAWALIEANQPAEALRLIENDLKRYPMDAYLHAVAGMAYYRMDDLDHALMHWKEAVAIDPKSGIEPMIRRAEREKAADRGSERMVGTRVVLRYERSTLSQPFAQAMLQALDEEYSRVSFQLGCRATEKVTAVAQSRASYMASTQAAEWSGGLYDGRIHVPVTESRQVTAETRRTFAHELVHACLHELGTWPSWLHEGLAQKFSGGTLPPYVRQSIETMRKAKQLPKLRQLGQNWSRMSSEHARVAYALAYFAAEKLIELRASTGLSNVLRNPSGIAQIEEELEKALDL